MLHTFEDKPQIYLGLICLSTALVGLVVDTPVMAQQSDWEVCENLRAKVGNSPQERAKAAQHLQQQHCLWDAAAVARSISPKDVPNKTRLALGELLLHTHYPAQALPFYRAVTTFAEVPKDKRLSLASRLSTLGWNQHAIALVETHFASAKSHTDEAAQTVEVYLRAKMPIRALHYIETRPDKRMNASLLFPIAEPDFVDQHKIIGGVQFAPGAVWPERFMAVILEEYWLGHQFTTETAYLLINETPLQSSCAFWAHTHYKKDGARILRQIKRSIPSDRTRNNTPYEVQRLLDECWRYLDMPEQTQRNLYTRKNVGEEAWFGVGIDVERGKNKLAYKRALQLLQNNHNVDLYHLLGHNNPNKQDMFQPLLTALARAKNLPPKAKKSAVDALQELQTYNTPTPLPAWKQPPPNKDTTKVLQWIQAKQYDRAFRFADMITDPERMGIALLQAGQHAEAQRHFWRALHTYALHNPEESTAQSRGITALLKRSCKTKQCLTNCEKRLQNYFPRTHFQQIWNPNPL